MAEQEKAEDIVEYIGRPGPSLEVWVNGKYVCSYYEYNGGSNYMRMPNTMVLAKVHSEAMKRHQEMMDRHQASVKAQELVKAAADASEQEVHAVQAIQDILWPEEEPDRQWSPDTMDEIAQTLINIGYGPGDDREDPPPPEKTEDDPEGEGGLDDKCHRCGHPKREHAQFIDRTVATMSEKPKRRHCQHFNTNMKDYCKCHKFEAEPFVEKAKPAVRIPDDFDAPMEMVLTDELVQLRRIDQAARRVYDQLEKSIEDGADCPDGLSLIIWEEFGRALFDGRAEPHEVRPPSTHEEVMASDNKVIKEAYVKSEKRCPHDGGKCTHNCDPGECFREFHGMSLSTPHEGYPLPGHEPRNISAQPPLAKLVQKALNLSRFAFEVRVPMSDEMHDALAEVRKAAGEYEAWKKEQESNFTPIEKQVATEELTFKTVVRKWHCGSLELHELEDGTYKYIGDPADYETDEQVRERKEQESNPDGWKMPEIENPDIFQRLKCAGGNHEPDELYKDITFERKTEMLPVQETVNVRKCKHCKCLYVEET